MADRYWVGGTANWDATAGTKWATTSGGAGGASVPTSADNVFFDAASGAVTVTVNASSFCAALNFTGFTGTFAGTSIVSVYGNFVASASMTFTHTGSLWFSGSATNTITTNGKSLTAIVFTGGTWSLQDSLTTSSNISFTGGTFNTSNNNISCLSFYYSSGAVTINLGSSTITISGSGNAFDFQSISPTLNTGTSTIILSNTSNVAFLGGGRTYYNVQFTGGLASNVSESVKTISGTNTFTNLSIIPSTGKCTTKIVNNITITGTFTSTGNTVKYRNTIQPSTISSGITITAATVSIQDTDFYYVTGAGAAAPWALSGQRVGNCGNNSGITFSSSVNRYAVTAGNYSDTATWSASSGGVSGASVPLPQDVAYFNAASGAGTYTIDFGAYSNIGEINCTGFTRTLSLTSGIVYRVYIYGSLILSSGMGFTPQTSDIIFRGEGSKTIDGQGKTLYALTIEANASSTYTLASNLTLSNVLTVASANTTFSTSNFNISALQVRFESASVVNLGSSTITVSGTGSLFVVLTVTTFNAGTSSINLTATNTTSRTFAGAGKTYYNLNIGGATGTSTLTFTGSNTFNTLSSTKTVANTILFTAGTTTTVADFTVDGTSGNVVTLGSTTSSPATLTKTGGGSITVDYASISNLTASPSSTWYATNSTDGGGNSGWTFGTASTGNSLFFGNNF